MLIYAEKQADLRAHWPALTTPDPWISTSSRSVVVIQFLLTKKKLWGTDSGWVYKSRDPSTCTMIMRRHYQHQHHHHHHQPSSSPSPSSSSSTPPSPTITITIIITAASPPTRHWNQWCSPRSQALASRRLEVKFLWSWPWPQDLWPRPRPCRSRPWPRQLHWQLHKLEKQDKKLMIVIIIN